ncbi:MAG: membrane protein insertase YidC [Paracoccaceae bacterium]
MDDQNKNLILASVLSFIVIITWFILFPPPEPVPSDIESEQQQSEESNLAPNADTAKAPLVETGETEIAVEAERIQIENELLTGAISTQGGRIDQLSLKNYRNTISEDSDIVTLLSPVGKPEAYYAAFGWAPAVGIKPDQVPDPNTIWTVVGNNILTPSSPISLMWDNGNGVKFMRKISIDEKYMFTVEQGIENNSGSEISLRPYGLLRRHGEPKDMKNFFILHEGIIRMSDGELSEEDYGDIADLPILEKEGTHAERVEVQNSGWTGFTDHYWMTTLIPDQSSSFRSTTKYFAAQDIYQVEAVMPSTVISDGSSTSISTQLFAGAKEWDTIRKYEQAGVTGFLDSIDWGWFFFLTKPMFAVLHWLNVIIGNMGWAIIGLTLIIKAVLFPLAYKSYASMAKMKELQPEMEKIKERVGDDRQKLQQEMMGLYKKEKVNPASGCLPILIQIPIFFSLYKVIFVTLELRHEPWFGWIRDLSAPDPSTILNLFGLLPWANPTTPGSILAIISLGILPILLGISMWLQQKLNPAPTDKTQAMIFAWMPWVFMFMLGTFASGLVIYWIANNTITFIQQYLIMRRQGYKPDVFGNILDSFKKKKGVE